LFTGITITPEIEGEYGEVLPDWVMVKTVQNRQKMREINQVLHLGESSAIRACAGE
jgi:predicted nucleic acid-binding protein